MSAPFKEGDVITFQGRIRIEDDFVPTVGTIFLIFHGEILALDAKGHLHKTKVSEVYLTQEVQ